MRRTSRGPSPRIPTRLDVLLTRRALMIRWADGMATGMATTKVTVTLDDEQLEAVRKLVQSGGAESVSGFVQHAVGIALNDVEGWSAMLGLALDRTGGPLTKK